MQELETYRNIVKQIAAGTHGQVPNVRTFMGRQVLFLQKTTSIFMLPYIESTPLQDTDTESETFGQFWDLVDHAGVDGGDLIF